jgi:hypothetical protein
MVYISYQKCQFRYIFEGLGMDNFGVFHDHLVSLVPVWYMLWPCCGHIGVFFTFGSFYHEKSGIPGPRNWKKSGVLSFEFHMYRMYRMWFCGIQGCQMVCFQTKNPYLGKFLRVLLWKILVYFITIWSILGPLEISYGHLVYILW